MKLQSILLFAILLLVISCTSNNNNNNYKEIEVIEEERDSIFEISEEVIVEIDEQEISDSLEAIFYQMESEYNNLKNDFDSNMSQCYIFSYDYSGVYEMTTEIWYFDSLFRLAYYVEKVGAEGGYESMTFQKYVDQNMNFHFNKEGVMDDIQTVIVSYDSEGGIINSVEFNPYLNKDVQYTLPFPEDLSQDYKKHLITIERSDFTSSKVYSYSDYENVESEYGGTESSGFTITVDSLLIDHLDF